MLVLLLYTFSPALSSAAAQSVILDISPEYDLSQGGNWARTFPTSDGWKITYSFNQDYWVADLQVSSDSWDIDESSARQLTDQGLFSDHAIERCPDGSLLHVASANLDQPNDSAWATRLSSDFEPLAGGWIDKRQPSRAHNDMALICGRTAQGVTFQDFGAQQVLFFHVDEAATVTGTTPVGGDLVMTGGDLAQHPEADQVLASAGTIDGGVQLVSLGPDLSLVDETTLDVVDPPLSPYWPQALLPVGDYLLLAFMARDQSQGWSADTGNVYLAVIDAERRVQEVVQVSQASAPDGGMRPGLSRSGDTLVLTWDRNNELFLYEVVLDLEAMGVDPGDTGWPGGTDGDWADGDTGGEAAAGGGCGCQAGGAPVGLSALAALATLGLIRRRRGVA